MPCRGIEIGDLGFGWFEDSITPRALFIGNNRKLTAQFFLIAG
jgi:hypothetical protein